MADKTEESMTLEELGAGVKRQFALLLESASAIQGGLDIFDEATTDEEIEDAWQVWDEIEQIAADALALYESFLMVEEEAEEEAEEETEEEEGDDANRAAG